MFTWDYEDRLTNLSGGGVPSTNYGYNGVGSRTSKSNTLGSRTYKRNGVGVTAPVLSDGVATMVPGISEKSGGVTSTILSDRMGSMKGLSNAGTVTDTAEFDAFGKVVSRTGTNATQKGFVGGVGEPRCGLGYLFVALAPTPGSNGVSLREASVLRSKKRITTIQRKTWVRKS